MTGWESRLQYGVICEEHRLTKFSHPWTSGQMERKNQTIKEATVKRFHYDSYECLKAHLNDCMVADNFRRRLRTFNGHTPYKSICKIWTSEPERFIINLTG